MIICQSGTTQPFHRLNKSVSYLQTVPNHRRPRNRTPTIQTRPLPTRKKVADATVINRQAQSKDRQRGGGIMSTCSLSVIRFFRTTKTNTQTGQQCLRSNFPEFSIDSVRSAFRIPSPIYALNVAHLEPNAGKLMPNTSCPK